MKKHDIEIIVSKYLDAKSYIKSRGYQEEIIWQDNICISEICESKFLSEAAWVVLSSGMRESVIKKVFPYISNAFFDWKSAETISANSQICKENALKHFGHEKKIDAIIKIAETINNQGYCNIIENIQTAKIARIMELPFMGPTTSYHFAKNIGLDVAKPDRHLIRIASNLGYSCPHRLCSDISGLTDEKLSVVDLVLWRYAVLNSKYLDFFC